MCSVLSLPPHAMIVAPSSGSGLRTAVTVLAAAAVDPARCAFRLLESPRAQAGFPSPAADYVDGALDLNELLVTNAPARNGARIKNVIANG